MKISSLISILITEKKHSNSGCYFIRKYHRMQIYKYCILKSQFTYSLVIKFNLFSLECCNLRHLFPTSLACFPWRMKRLLQTWFLIVTFKTRTFCKWLLFELWFLFNKSCARSTTWNIKYITNLHKNVLKLPWDCRHFQEFINEPWGTHLSECSQQDFLILQPCKLSLGRLQIVKIYYYWPHWKFVQIFSTISTFSSQ